MSNIYVVRSVARKLVPFSYTEHIILVSYCLFHIQILVYMGTVLTGRIIDINVAIINYYSAIITF